MNIKEKEVKRYSIEDLDKNDLFVLYELMNYDNSTICNTIADIKSVPSTLNDISQKEAENIAIDFRNSLDIKVSKIEMYNKEYKKD